MRFALIVALGLAFGPVAAQAQDAQTLADVRQELTVLNVEVQKLRRELSTTGGASVAVTGGSVLERVNAMESELQRLTSKTEELENRINRVVTDGTNRIGDLEFRLVELEGGDVGSLGQTSTLGGGEMPATMAPATPVPAPADPLANTSTPTNTAELAVGEKIDFERAKAALADGDFRSAADQFATFNQTYPGGPLGPEADLRRGDALDGLGDTREAARAYLASFSADPAGPVAAEALYQLGSSLGALGQTQEACVTLGEVASRFPTSPFVAQAQSERSVLACQ
ncbi:tol-pal system protein YbgF [Sulfitobacter sp. M39]|uniref:tol-pal system protein YbgF n=1 Tax=Sulfitobacter sp. M39 TaxID=2675334 RepID=UPI001F004AC3|nr:tol-pal system protein YbgF [Sulfitobacter sp. M39]MCF7746928.1 tol-pal system protein YbgF [Sulfitobacter sp. M39]